MTRRSAAPGRRWSPIGSRTADQATAQRAISATIAASCNATAMPDIASSPAAPRSNGMRLAGCWAHLRRQFFDLHANGESVVATATVEQMKLLWAVEDDVRGQPPEARLAARRAASVAVVQSLFDLWERELPRISGKSKLAEAIRYARSHRAALLLFLEDGRVEIDSNIVERAIRPQAITRKNSLFAGSVGGGRTGPPSRPCCRPAR